MCILNTGALDSVHSRHRVQTVREGTLLAVSHALRGKDDRVAITGYDAYQPATPVLVSQCGVLMSETAVCGSLLDD